MVNHTLLVGQLAEVPAIQNVPSNSGGTFQSCSLKINITRSWTGKNGQHQHSTIPIFVNASGEYTVGRVSRLNLQVGEQVVIHGYLHAQQKGGLTVRITDIYRAFQGQPTAPKQQPQQAVHPSQQGVYQQPVQQPAVQPVAPAYPQPQQPLPQPQQPIQQPAQLPPQPVQQPAQATDEGIDGVPF